jgi:hypothetical protein
MRQRRAAEGSALSTGLSTTAKYVRRTASGARAAASASRSITCDAQLPPHLPCVLLLLLKRRVAAGKGLGTGLGTTVTYVRPQLRLTTPLRRGHITACVTAPRATDLVT